VSITTGTVPLPAEVEQRMRRRTAAVRWRCDHINHPDRDRLWAWYVNGALLPWRVRGAERKAVRAGLADAERTVSFSPLDAP
jgi:hypothetical protein